MYLTEKDIDDLFYKLVTEYDLCERDIPDSLVFYEAGALWYRRYGRHLPPCKLSVFGVHNRRRCPNCKASRKAMAAFRTRMDG